MDAKELRLGNWVNFKFSDISNEVMICHNDLRNFEMNIKMGGFNDIYQPIPLTEEWLLRFAFDNLGDYGFGIGEFHIINRVGKWGFPINDKIVFINYVHQLQNLYFSLTQKELQIK